MTEATPAPVLLVYDKQCPVCDAYCRLVRIQESAGALQLVDARAPSAIMAEITRSQLDIDQGMVLKHHGVLYYGSEAIHRLALLSSKTGLFNRFNYFLFRSSKAADVLYPALRFCRNLLLKALHKTKINNLGKPNNARF